VERKGGKHWIEKGAGAKAPKKKGGKEMPTEQVEMNREVGTGPIRWLTD